MEKETYKVATQILEKFDPSKLSASKPSQGYYSVLIHLMQNKYSKVVIIGLAA